MTVTLELTPDEAERYMNAESNGINVLALFRQFMDKTLPSRNKTGVDASPIRPVTAQPLLPSPLTFDDKRREATLAWLESRTEEARQATPEEIAEADKEHDELMEDLHRWRYPELYENENAG